MKPFKNMASAFDVGRIVVFLEPVANLGAGNCMSHMRKQFDHLRIIQIKNEADSAHYVVGGHKSRFSAGSRVSDFDVN